MFVSRSPVLKQDICFTVVLTFFCFKHNYILNLIYSLEKFILHKFAFKMYLFQGFIDLIENICLHIFSAISQKLKICLLPYYIIIHKCFACMC